MLLQHALLQEAHEALYELELEALAAQHVVDEGIDVTAPGTDAPAEAGQDEGGAVLKVEDMQQVLTAALHATPLR